MCVMTPNVSCVLSLPDSINNSLYIYVSIYIYFFFHLLFPFFFSNFFFSSILAQTNARSTHTPFPLCLYDWTKNCLCHLFRKKKKKTCRYILYIFSTTLFFYFPWSQYPIINRNSWIMDCASRPGTSYAFFSFFHFYF